MDTLSEYKAKRRFDRTPEPKGRKGRRTGRLYTIQKHDARRLHYDLRLELDGVLKSWAVTKGPSLNPATKRLAVRVEDHPLDYARFEGTIPEGNYGAGTVLLWDQGKWDPIGDPHDGLASGKLVFRLDGQRLHGRWALVRFHGRERSKRENWLLIKEHDEAATGDDGITDDAMTSVASGRDLKAIEAAPDAVWESERPKQSRRNRKRRRGPTPEFVPVALATLVDALPSSSDWLFEVKFDGYRALAATSGDDVRIYTRNGNDWTNRYPAIVRALAGLDLDRALLDGEVVAVDSEGRSDFGLLQQALQQRRGGLVFFAFDLLSLAGKDLRNEPLVRRKEKLRALLADVPRSGPIAYADHLTAGGEAFLRTLCEKRFEGVIAKRANAPYRPGRGGAWLKIKCRNEREFVMIGWSPSDAGRSFSSILLAQYDGGTLRYAGRVGTGFSQDDLAALADRFRSLTRKDPPSDAAIPKSVRRSAQWLEPELVATIAFAELTRDGIVRQGRFIGLREDKPATAVERETTKPLRVVTERADLALTHPDKVLYPGSNLTKRDVAAYLEAASGRMLPHLKDRPVSLLRCPDGLSGECFFQRHPGRGTPSEFRRIEAEEKHGKPVTYLAIDDTAGLLAAAQIGVLEFHIWGVQADDLDHPDRIVFDLDPDPSIPFARVRDAAFHMRAALQALGLESFPLLTGGKGVHVVVPVARRHPWPVIKQFSKSLAERFATEAPDLYVANIRKAQRENRIYIDYLRNDRTASAIAPYSPRGRELATVAWPVTWNRLEATATLDPVSLPAAAARLTEPDPWADYPKVKQSVTAKALRALGVPS